MGSQEHTPSTVHPRPCPRCRGHVHHVVDGPRPLGGHYEWAECSAGCGYSTRPSRMCDGHSLEHTCVRYRPAVCGDRCPDCDGCRGGELVPSSVSHPGGHVSGPNGLPDNVRWDRVREARRKVAQGLDSDERALAVTADRLLVQLVAERHRDMLLQWWEGDSYE